MVYGILVTALLVGSSHPVLAADSPAPTGATPTAPMVPVSPAASLDAPVDGSTTEPATQPDVSLLWRNLAEENTAATRPTSASQPNRGPSTRPASKPVPEAWKHLEDPLDACEILIDSGKQDAAGKQLLEVRRKLGQPPHPRIEAQLAHIALLDKHPEQAQAIIAPWMVKKEPYEVVVGDAYVAAGWTLVAQQQYQKAVTLLDWVAGNSQYLTQVRAALGCGEAFLGLKDYKQAAECLNFASQTLTVQDRYGKHPALRKRIEAGLATAKYGAECDKYGEDYVLFRDAEMYRRFVHNYAKAHEVYGKLIEAYPQSPFVEPASLFDALSQIELGQVSKGEAALLSFRQQFKDGGLYGEALLELGRIALERRIDLRLADEYITSLNDWIKATRKPDCKLKEFEVRSATKAMITPPKKFKVRDQWGNFINTRIDVGEVVNPVTCPWYLDELDGQSTKLLGFIRFSQGKKEEAIAAYQRILVLDPEAGHQEANDDWNDYRRLKWAVDHGYLYAYPCELELYNKRQRFAILLADFYYCSTQFEKAIEVYRRVLKNEFGNLTIAQQEYPHFALGSVLYRLRFRQGDYSNREFLAEMDAILAVNSGSFTAQRAALAYSNIGSETDNDKVNAKAKKHLLDLAQSPLKTEWTSIAKIKLANQKIAEGKSEEGLAMLRQFSKADGDFYGMAQYFIKQHISHVALQNSPPAQTQEREEQ